MNKTITSSELISLINNHKDNHGLPFKTNSVVINLKQLQDFIKQADNLPGCDAIKINFIRYPLAEGANDSRIESAGQGLSQVSLIFVPVRTLNEPEWRTVDLENTNGQIFTLSVCVPGSSEGIDRTGLVPPKGGK